MSRVAAIIQPAEPFWQGNVTSRRQQDARADHFRKWHVSRSEAAFWSGQAWYPTSHASAPAVSCDPRFVRGGVPVAKGTD